MGTIGERNNKKIDVKAETRQISDAERAELMQRVSAGRTKLLALVPFFGHLCLNLKPREARPEDNVQTAAVARDGTLILNYDFCKQLSMAEFCGLLCHEVLHPALFCWERQGIRAAIVSGPGGQRFSLWNLAHDLSFNGQILELAKNSDAAGEIDLPPGGSYDKKFDGQAAEEIYDALLKEALKNKQQGKGGDGAMGVLTAIPGGGGHEIGDDMRDDLAESKDGQDAGQGDAGAQRRLEEEWKVNILAAAQVQEQEKGKGSMPGGLSKIIEELREPRVDWKDVLSRWIGENGRRQDLTYRRPARRSESIGEYMPRVMKFGIDDVIILWDTSGSMNGREGEILGDVAAICEDLGLALRIIMCDADVQADVHDVRDALEVSSEVKGGGGSSFLPAFKLMEDDNFEGVVVCFTDGAINVPASKPPLIKDVLWVLGPNDINPTEHYGGGSPWGEVLRVNDDAFKR